MVLHTVPMTVRSGSARPVGNAVLALAVLTLAGCTSGRAAAPTAPAAPVTRPAAAPAFPAAAERTRRGDPSWSAIKVGSQHDVEGYTDHDSVLPGQRVRLFVSTIARHVPWTRKVADGSTTHPMCDPEAP